MATPSILAHAFGHLDLDPLLHPLPEVDHLTNDLCIAIIHDRDRMANHFIPTGTGAPNFDVGLDREPIAEYARRVIAQGLKQKAGLHGRQRKTYVTSIKSSSESADGSGRMRPFCTLINNTSINRFLQDHVAGIARVMDTLCITADTANLAAWQVHNYWDFLNPIQRARGVLAADKWMKDNLQHLLAARQRRLQAVGGPSIVAQSLSHTTQLVALTTRQARRSGSTQAELRARWA